MRHFEVLNFEVIGMGSNLGKLEKMREIYFKEIREFFEVNH